MNDVSVFNDQENGVLLLRPTGNGTGTATITVTVTDSENNSTSQDFSVTVTEDTANGAPFLNDIPTLDATAGVANTFNLSSQDAEGDAVVYSVQQLGQQAFGLSVDQSSGQVTMTPPAGFSGQLQFLATVQQTSATTTSSTTDTQVVTVNVTDSAPTSIDLRPVSDSGSSNIDDLTNASSLVFFVDGTTAGATVNIRAGGSVVGTAVAVGFDHRSDGEQRQWSWGRQRGFHCNADLKQSD